jgi:hypothetical protein
MTYAEFCEAVGRGIINGLILTPFVTVIVYLIHKFI